MPPTFYWANRLIGALADVRFHECGRAVEMCIRDRYRAELGRLGDGCLERPAKRHLVRAGKLADERSGATACLLYTSGKRRLHYAAGAFTAISMDYDGKG